MQLTRHVRLIALLLSALLAAPALGEDDGWIDLVEEDVDQQNQQWVVQPEQFERWVFQNTGTADEQRKQFESQMQVRLREISDSCELTEEQVQKLRRAGALDVQRFFDRYEAIERRYMETKGDRDQFNNLWQVIQPLQQQAQAGVFGRDSLFTKVARHMMDASQRNAYKETERLRRSYRYRALVELYVMLIEESIPLSSQQRTELTALLLEETSPPSVFGQNDQIYILYQSSKVPKDKLRQAIGGPVGKLIGKLFERGGAYEHHLKSQGVVPYEEQD